VVKDCDAIADVRIEVCQAALDLCDRKKPRTALDAQVSLYHWAARALLYGSAGLDEYATEALTDPTTIALQDRMKAGFNSGLEIDQAVVTLSPSDGRTLEQRVEHCIGSRMNPMTDAQLEQKFISQAETDLSPDRVEKLAAQCWKLVELASIAELVGIAN
jgi:2-methylcitrate dehydratase PrpD